MIEELEEEANELRALAVRCGGHVLKSLEDEKTKLANDLKEVEARYKTTQEELSKLEFYKKKMAIVSFNDKFQFQKWSNKTLLH